MQMRAAIQTFILAAAFAGTVCIIASTPVMAAEPPAATGAPAGSAADRLQRVGDAAGFQSADKEKDLATYIGTIIKAAMSLIGVIFVAQMVYAGWLWMTSRDEADQLDRAKHIIRRSIVGLAIVLAAWAITSFVLTRLYLASQGTL